eukprot:94002-Amphidinium_carterae.1
MIELVAHPTETSSATRKQVDVRRIHMQRQQLDANQKEHHSRLLHQEYQAAVLAMETSMTLQHVAETQSIEQHAQQWYHDRWQALEQEALLEYSRARSVQLRSWRKSEQAANSEVQHELRSLREWKRSAAKWSDTTAVPASITAASHSFGHRSEG